MQRRLKYFAELVFVFAFLLAPSVTNAFSCSANGYTIVFVNGVFDTEDQAKYDTKKLQFFLGSQFNNQPIDVLTGYNQTHLAGAGDLFESYFPSFDQFDLNTILMQIQPEVQTRKLLVVGHSQGAVYANKMYEYLVTHGEPASATAVYAVASPDSYVAGGGKYLTYTLDEVIGGLPLLKKFNPLPANIDFIDLLKLGQKNPPPPYHSFTDTYLGAFAHRMIPDINTQLAALKADAASSTGNCFEPPPKNVAYKAQQVLFAVADPTAIATKVASVGAYKGVVAAGAATVALAKAGAATVSGAFGLVANAFSKNPVTVIEQHPAENFEIVKKLYGSSLDKKDYQELNTSNQGAAAVLALAKLPLAGFVAGAETDPDPPDMPVVAVASTTAAASSTSPVVQATTTPIAQTNTTSAATTTPNTVTAALDSSWGVGGGGPAPGPTAPVVTTPAPTPTVLFDASTTPPTLTIAECSASLSTSFCLLGATGVTLSWSAPAGATNYGIVVGGVQTQTTTGTGATLTLQDGATTTLAIVAYDASSTAATSSTQSVTVAVPFAPQAGNSIADTFDTFNSAGWQPFGSNVKNFDFDDGTDGECFHNGCVVGMLIYPGSIIPRMYLETNPPLSSGAFTVYAKARLGFMNFNPYIALCNVGSGCAGTPREVIFLHLIPLDSAWHHYYIAWKQGLSYIERCALTDDINPAHCVWVETNIALGTQFDGIVFASQNGYRADLGDNFWFDELAPVQ